MKRNFLRMFAGPWLVAALFMAAVPVMPASASTTNLTVFDCSAEIAALEALAAIDDHATVAIEEMRCTPVSASLRRVPAHHAKIHAIAAHNLRMSAVDDHRPASRWLL